MFTTSNKKVYLSDSVYADVKNNGIILTTENGLPHHISNIIYLNNKVIKQLLDYVEITGIELED